MQNNKENLILVNADCSHDELEGCMVSRRARASSAAIYFYLTADSRVFGPDLVNARDYDGLTTTLLMSIPMEWKRAALALRSHNATQIFAEHLWGRNAPFPLDPTNLVHRLQPHTDFSCANC
jgi:hypothetical protein